MDKNKEAQEYIKNTVFVDHTDFSDAIVSNMRLMAFCAGWDQCLNSRQAEESDLKAIKDYIKWDVERNVCKADPHYFKETRDGLLRMYLESKEAL